VSNIQNRKTNLRKLYSATNKKYFITKDVAVYESLLDTASSYSYSDVGIINKKDLK